MQGVWKENLGGWNTKGIKRKKQTRNHTIKDKAKAILKNYSEEHDDLELYKSDKNILTNSSITEYTTCWRREKKVFPTIVKYFKIRLYFDNIHGKTETHTFRAFLHNGLWLTENCISIFDSLDLSWQQKYHAYIVKVKLIGEFRPNWTEHKKVEISYNTSYYPEGTTYLYNKPFYDWRRWFLYKPNKRRKFALHTANSADRMAIKTFISNKDWDAELKTHALSKSILWEIS